MAEPKVAGSVIATLGSAIFHGAHRLDSVPGLVKQVIKDDLWRVYVLPGGGKTAEYSDFAAFVHEELKASLEILRDLCRRDSEALNLIDTAAKRKPGPKGNSVYNINRTPLGKGTSKSYAIRRLASDRPDLHAKVLAKELTAHKAMVEAGFAPKQITVFTDPARAARTLRKHFDRAALRRLVELLGSEDGT